MTSRREFVLGAAAFGIASGSVTVAKTADALRPLWEAWKASHVTADGRVVDRYQDGVSHSEGQGYAMMIAQAVGDASAFERIWRWSQDNLQHRPDDALLAWRWTGANGTPVPDLNNATDGDLFHAWALFRAAQRFGVIGYRTAAKRIAEDLVALCLRPAPDAKNELLLLPGAVGFEHDGALTVNASYILPVALDEIGTQARLPELAQCARDGLALLNRLSGDALPPDWAQLTADGPRDAPNLSGKFGYDAMRVPLNLLWSGQAGHPIVARAAALYQPFVSQGYPQTPTIVDRKTRAIEETSGDRGYAALAALVSCAVNPVRLGAMPSFQPRQPYYPATLHFLALLAQTEATYACYS